MNFATRPIISWLSWMCVAAGVVLIGLSFYQQFSSEFWFWWQGQSGTTFTVDQSQVQAGQAKLIEPASTDFGLVVEKININQAVTPDIDPFRPDIYEPALQRNPVAHAKGTVNPGQKGLTYLFAHSTVNAWEIGRYQAPFTLLSKLEQGDRIVTYYQGQRYDYYVTDKQVVAPTNIEVLNQHPDYPMLILQTCDPPGENTERLLIIAQMKPNQQTSNALTD